MLSSYTAKYTRTKSGYTGQIVEWPEVVTEGKDVDECRAMLEDALRIFVIVIVVRYRSRGFNFNGHY